MEQKLTPEDKLKIALSGEKSLRELAEEYGVHHSTIDEIRKDAAKLLKDYWEEKSKRVGRPKKEVNMYPQAEELQKELEATKKTLALQNMKTDYLELQLKWKTEDLEEAKVKQGKHLKKKKRRNS